MKRLLFVSLAFSLVLSVIALAQDTMKQGDDQMKHDDMKSEKMSKKAVSISGKVGDDGKTLMSDKDNKNWKVSNPEALKGHEGHHVTVRAHVDADKDEIHVTSVKMAGEMKDTMKKDEMHH
jgi:pentapeptide MXKDX repeat protein